MESVLIVVQILILSRLWIKQKGAIKIISYIAYKEHTRPLFESHRILPSYKLVKYSNIKIYARFCAWAFTFIIQWAVDHEQDTESWPWT